MDTALKPSAISVIPSLCATLFLTCTGITGFYRSMDKLLFIGMAAGIAVCLYGLWIAVISLEFAPRTDVVRWANEVVTRHPYHEAILITHAYLYHDNQRYDWKQAGTKQDWNPHSYGVAAGSDDVMDGEQLWSQLVSKHENFIMTLNGHVLGDGLGRLRSRGESGNDVHQMLVNYQMHDRGGDGWMRLLEFRPNGAEVKVCDYSPVRNQRNESCHTAFTLNLSQDSKQSPLG